MLLACLNSFAQQDPQYSQYMFNHFVVNPAYAGSRDVLNVSATARDQWTGYAGKVQTQALTATMPLRSKNVGIGVNFINDKIGPTATKFFAASYAYHLRVRNNKLSFGLRAGVMNYVLNWDALTPKDQGDQLIGSGMQSKTVPVFDFGAYYYGNNGYISASLTHLNNAHFSTISTGTITTVQHLFVSASKAFTINEQLVLNPSCMFKVAKSTPASVDINLNARLFNKLWIGSSFKVGYGLSFLAQYNVTDRFKVGYSYDWGFIGIGKYTGTTHEFFIGYDFRVSNAKILSTRFL